MYLIVKQSVVIASASSAE